MIPLNPNASRDYNGLAIIKRPWGMPKHICKAWDGEVGRWFGRRCGATAVKTRRGAWRCPLHGGLSTGPKTAEGKARIAAAARARWEAYRVVKAPTAAPAK